MITLYHCVGARSFRPLWMLEELGAPYALRMLAFPPRLVERTFLDENPLGTVPLLIDGETRMAESAAMLEYLAHRHAPTPLQVMPEEADFGAYLDYLHFGEATLTTPQTLVLRYSRFEPEARRQPQVVEDYGRGFSARLKTLEPHLARHETLCAGRFTAADISVGFALHLAQMLGLDAWFTPAVAGYWARLKARPAFARSLAAEREAALAQGVDPTPAPLTTPPAPPPRKG